MGYQQEAPPLHTAGRPAQHSPLRPEHTPGEAHTHTPLGHVAVALQPEATFHTISISIMGTEGVKKVHFSSMVKAQGEGSSSDGRQLQGPSWSGRTLPLTDASQGSKSRSTLCVYLAFLLGFPRCSDPAHQGWKTFHKLIE